jgi:hypothetical protein
MSKIHVLPDENLGGVLREFIEVERRPNVGEYVLITRFSGEYVNHIAKVTSVDRDLNQFRFSPEIDCYSVIRNIFDYDCGEKCSVLEPTDIVHIDGARYRLVDRKTKVGDRIMNRYDCVPTTVIRVDKYGIEAEPYETKDGFMTHGMLHGFYYVLEPVEPAEEGDDVLTVNETEASKSVLDLLANLARRVTELERKLDSAYRRIDVLHDDVDSLISDVTELNYIKQPLEAIIKAVKGDE